MQVRVITAAVTNISQKALSQMKWNLSVGLDYTQS